MSYNDKFRVSAHAIILNQNQEVLLLKTTYAEKNWSLPGGSPEGTETIYETLLRECKEELGCDIIIGSRLDT